MKHIFEKQSEDWGPRRRFHVGPWDSPRDKLHPPSPSLSLSNIPAMSKQAVKLDIVYGVKEIFLPPSLDTSR